MREAELKLQFAKEKAKARLAKLRRYQSTIGKLVAGGRRRSIRLAAAAAAPGADATADGPAAALARARQSSLSRLTSRRAGLTAQTAAGRPAGAQPARPGVL